METYESKLKRYYDEEEKLIQYPTKKPLRVMALEKIAKDFEMGRDYTEKEVNEIIRSHIAFSDHELIRRKLFQYKFVGRLKNGSKYWREEGTQIESL